MVTFNDISKAVSALAETYPITSCYLFGSYARGEAREDSDVDLIIDLSEDITYLTLERMQIELSDILCLPVDLKTMNALKANPLFYKYIKDDLVEVFTTYDSDRRLIV